MIVAAVLLLATVAWGGQQEGLRRAVPAELVPVKAKQGQTAFFDRPVALAAARSSAVPYPVVVLLQSDPWLKVIGSDSPEFALYSDGQVIYRNKSGFKSARLNRAQQDEVVRPFTNSDLASLAGYYDASHITDQPDNNILVYGQKVPFVIAAYGSLRNADVRSRLPKAVIAAFDRLRDFEVRDAQDWVPEKVEVMVWPYDYAPDKSIVWPNRWPDLNDRTTRKRGESFSIFVAASELPALKAFLATTRPKGAVEINGKKWAVSVRFPFPHERLWMSPKTK